MGAKEEINRIAEYFKDDEDFDVKFYESEDALEFLIATAVDDSSIPKSEEEKELNPEDDGEKIEGSDGEGEQEIIIEREGGDENAPPKKKNKKEGDEEQEGEDEQEGEEEEDDENAPKKKKKKQKKEKSKRKLKVGDKVTIKSSGRIGVVTSVNDDGTYTISDSPDLPEISLFKEYAEGGAINEDTEIGKFQEDELEIIQDEEDEENEDGEGDEDGEGEGEGDEQEDEGKKSKNVNFDELFERLERVAKIRYKLPAFIYSFFSFDVTKIMGKIYLQNVCKLALLNRIAKDVLKYKSVLGDEQAEFMLEDIRSLYYNHIEFLNDSTERFGDTYRLKYSNANIETILKDWQNQGKNILTDEADIRELVNIKLYLSNIEKTQVTDNQYYRIISLSAIYNPELFNNGNHLKPHLDFIKQYLKINDLAFSNIYNSCFTGVMINEEFLYDKLIASNAISSKNLNIYNIIKNNDEYIIYACINILLAPSNTDKLEIHKLKLEDVSYVTNVYNSNEEFELYSSAQRSIWLGLDNFYHYCVQLRSSELNRQISFDNLNKLSKLQVQSYKNFLSDFKLQTVRYGSL